MKTVSVHLPFKTIENCRDLGGIPTKDGRVTKNSLLYRSADLHKASQQDLMTLQEMGLKHVVDLRTEWEIAAQPDHLMKDWQLRHLPVLHESDVAKQEGGQLAAAQDFISSPGHDFKEIYPLLVLDKQAISVWKTFFHELIVHPGSYLFHCTQGKDRTGTAAILILTALGVDEKLIEEDYLQTNLYMRKDLDRDEEFLDRLPADLKEKMLKNLEGYLEGYMEAKPEYYQAQKDAVTKAYGGYEGYLKKALGLDEEQLQSLRDFYLL